MEEIEQAVILLEQELTDKQIQDLEKDKYTVTFENQGQIDYTQYYLYHFEKR